MKLMLITVFGLLSGAGVSAATKSPAEVISEYARSCYQQVGAQISIGLAQAYHSAKPGSKAERDAKATLDNFIQDKSDFPAFETGCNETLDGDPKFTCYSQGYARETRRIVRAYNGLDAEKTTPECAYLNAAR